jgi:hypothetical protein
VGLLLVVMWFLGFHFHRRRQRWDASLWDASQLGLLVTAPPLRWRFVVFPLFNAFRFFPSILLRLIAFSNTLSQMIWFSV